MSDEPEPQAIPPDYDRNPARFRTARSVLRRHGLAPDVHERVARRFTVERLLPVLDVGCGEGELARHLPDGGWAGVDNSTVMAARAPEPMSVAEATKLPFAAASFDSVALLYVLYHLPLPELALAEAYRVLRPGGRVAVAAPSRHDSPELAHLLPTLPITSDAEQMPELLAIHFGDIELEHWDAPLIELPTRAAVCDYLIGKGLGQAAADAGAGEVGVPLSVTKRGTLAFARRS